MAKENKNILDVIKGIQQSAFNAYDGAYDKEGKPIEIGLKREEGNPMIDSRTMDGFSVKIQGDKLIVNYQSEIKIKEVYGTKFEQEIDYKIEDIVKYLKKQYKDITNSTLSLKPQKDLKVLVQTTSRVRAWVQATSSFKIENFDLEPTGEKDLEKKRKISLDFLNLKSEKRPSNEKISKKDNEKKEKE